MKTEFITYSVVVSFLHIEIISNSLGTTLIPGDGSFNILTLPDVTDTDYQTVYITKRHVEDIGNIEVLSLSPLFDFLYKGNGSLRWQISGNGGVNWNTIGEGSFNAGVLTEDFIEGAGLWITNILPGDTNYLQLQMQVKSADGTAVSSQIVDLSSLIITYRKTVIQ